MSEQDPSFEINFDPRNGLHFHSPLDSDNPMRADDPGHDDLHYDDNGLSKEELEDQQGKYRWKFNCYRIPIPPPPEPEGGGDHGDGEGGGHGPHH